MPIPETQTAIIAAASGFELLTTGSAGAWWRAPIVAWQVRSFKGVVIGIDPVTLTGFALPLEIGEQAILLPSGGVFDGKGYHDTLDDWERSLVVARWESAGHPVAAQA